MNYLNGPMLAFVFPETDSRLIPIEAAIYWVQHGLMFIIPIYLLRLNINENHSSAYQMEPLSDWTWNIISYACLLIYHFVVLVTFATVNIAFYFYTSKFDVLSERKRVL